MSVIIQAGQYLYRFSVFVTNKITKAVHKVELQLYTEIEYLVRKHLFDVYDPNNFSFSTITKEWSDDF